MPSLHGIEDGAAKGNVLRTVAIAAQSQVTTGEDELGFAGAGFAEDGHALPVAEAADIVLELPVETRVPCGTGHALEDRADHGLRVARVESALDGGLGDAPVVLGAGAGSPCFGET